VETVNTLLLAFVAAATVEAVWETLKMGWEDGKIRVDTVGPIVLGLVVAFTLPVDIFELLGFSFSVEIVGKILTGILISRGSNWIHDWINRIQADWEIVE
jgi:hypothetical protein